MDDLIKREAVLDYMNGWKGDTVNFVRNLPAVKAVPLDKLCEWLNKNQGELPPCPFDDDCYECGLDGVACIKRRITAWMEGL